MLKNKRPIMQTTSILLVQKGMEGNHTFFYSHSFKEIKFYHERDFWRLSKCGSQVEFSIENAIQNTRDKKCITGVVDGDIHMPWHA